MNVSNLQVSVGSRRQNDLKMNKSFTQSRDKLHCATGDLSDRRALSKLLFAFHCPLFVFVLSWRAELSALIHLLSVHSYGYICNHYHHYFNPFNPFSADFMVQINLPTNQHFYFENNEKCRANDSLGRSYIIIQLDLTRASKWI